jgi:hypothetical protein
VAVPVLAFFEGGGAVAEEVVGRWEVWEEKEGGRAVAEEVVVMVWPLRMSSMSPWLRGGYEESRRRTSAQACIYE